MNTTLEHPLCETPWDQSPEDGPGPLEDGFGSREHFSPGPGAEKNGKTYLFSLDFSGHLGNIVIFSEKSNFIPYFGPCLEKKGKKISLFFLTF